MADFDAKYVLVPREPTQEMIDAGEAKDCPAATYSGYAEERATAEDHYRAMIAAAPTLPNSEEVAVMVKRLRGTPDDYTVSPRDREVADLLEALDAELRALKDRL